MHKYVYLMHYAGAWRARPQIPASPAGVGLDPAALTLGSTCQKTNGQHTSHKDEEQNRNTSAGGACINVLLK